MINAPNSPAFAALMRLGGASSSLGSVFNGTNIPASMDAKNVVCAMHTGSHQMKRSHVVTWDLTITLMSCNRSCHEFTRFFIACLRAFSSCSSCSFCEPACKVRSSSSFQGTETYVSCLVGHRHLQRHSPHALPLRA